MVVSNLMSAPPSITVYGNELGGAYKHLILNCCICI